MNPEVRAGTEFRVSGRTLTGRVMSYGTVSPEHREFFRAGAFSPIPAVPMRLQHDRNMEVLPAGKFILNDMPRALEIRAELPLDSAALALVKSGAMSWLVCRLSCQEGNSRVWDSGDRDCRSC